MRRKNGEGSYKNKTINGITYKAYVFPDGHCVYGRTAADRDRKMKEYKDKLDAKQIVDPVTKDVYFGDYCDVWLKTKRSDLTDAVYDSYEGIIKARIKKFWIGDIPLSILNENMFQKYLKELSKEYSKGTIDKTWMICKQVIRYGVNDNAIQNINLELIKPPREHEVAHKKKEVKFVTPHDMELIHEEAQKDIYGDGARVLDFIMYSGLRISEARGLLWKDVAHDFSSIDIRRAQTRVVNRNKDGEAILDENGARTYIEKSKDTKTQSGNRSIPLPDRAIEILKYFDEKFDHNKDSFVFVNKNGEQFKKRGLEQTLHRITKNLELENKDYTPHELRHGYGSVLISKGVDIKIVSELMGHSDVSTTYNIYIGILRDDKIKAVRGAFNK